MSSHGNQQIELFSNLVRVHHASLRAFVRALGAEEAWVDDIAQEVFLVAFRNYAKFDPSADFGKWLRGIARNLVANERRKGARHTRLLPAVVVDVLLNQTPEAINPGYEPNDLLPAMRECVAQLPPRSQELLHHRYTEGENANQLAERLRTRAEAVRQSLVRIRATIKTCVERKLGEARP
ncbi:MAG: sigma-70 family RNA polymerase sigma factor [Nibricoccus sp.]